MTIQIRHYQKREMTNRPTTLPLPQKEGKPCQNSACEQNKLCCLDRQEGRREDADGLGSSQEERAATD